MTKRLKNCVFALWLATALSAPAGAACEGSCNGDDAVTVDEIIQMVNIALGESPADACSAGDTDSSGSITVDEILTAVNNALEGCQPSGSGLGRRRFELDPQRSGVRAVLAPGFDVNLGNFRGQNGNQTGNAFFEFEGGEVDPETGLALLNVTAASDYIFAQAQIANILFCLKPIVPVASAGVIACNGGYDYSIALSVDHVLGRVGEDGYDLAQCLEAGGRVESPNQICGNGPIGAECFLNSDCDSAPGAGDGVCGLTAGQCSGGNPIGGRRPCNTSADCPDGGECLPARCSEGKVDQPCRNAGDCDTAAGADDGVCGQVEAHPGACNGQIGFAQLGGDSGAGSVVIAPRPDLGLVGLPMQLSLEQELPCGDEGALVSQAFALTSGTARVEVRNFSGGNDDLVFDQNGENLQCSEFAQGTGGRLVFGFPTLHLNPMSGGDLVIGFTFQGL